jgi:hypothetical protein
MTHMRHLDGAFLCGRAARMCKGGPRHVMDVEVRGHGCVARNSESSSKSRLTGLKVRDSLCHKKAP